VQTQLIESASLLPLAVNNFEIVFAAGGIQMEDCGITRVDNPGDIRQLLNAMHFDDINMDDIRKLIRQYQSLAMQTGTQLPRDVMTNKVEDEV
jgi:hypothetical protein